jgi:hypothetical protein
LPKFQKQLNGSTDRLNNSSGISPRDREQINREITQAEARIGMWNSVIIGLYAVLGVNVFVAISLLLSRLERFYRKSTSTKEVGDVFKAIGSFFREGRKAVGDFFKRGGKATRDFFKETYRRIGLLRTNSKSNENKKDEDSTTLKVPQTPQVISLDGLENNLSRESILKKRIEDKIAVLTKTQAEIIKRIETISADQKLLKEDVEKQIVQAINERDKNAKELKIQKEALELVPNVEANIAKLKDGLYTENNVEVVKALEEHIEAMSPKSKKAVSFKDV